MSEMENSGKNKTIVISLGGSLLIPDEIDTGFVKNFKSLIDEQLQKGISFIIVVGGGKIARKYIEAGAALDSMDDEDKDWLGIHATRMNAHFIRAVFRKDAFAKINKDPENLEEFKSSGNNLLIAAGWKPGNSTDFVAVSLTKNLGSKKVINLSNIDYVYDKDPGKFFTAKAIKETTWEEFRKMVGETWSPGMNAPFDPIASKLADEEGMEVAIMNGKDMDNLKAYLEGREFKGTMIR